MDVRSDKLKIIKEIIAFKASCDNFPNLKLTNSLPSINNLVDSIAYLLDLIKSIVGVDVLKEKLIEILTYELEGFELAIKNVLKQLIKEVFSCGISPTIPPNLITTGLNFDLERIDIFDILKVDPDSLEGSIVYTFPDPSTGVGNDFNYFLYETIQLGTPNTWKNLLTITFIPIGGIVDGQIKNNVINVKIHPSYINKTIFQFLNDFIDSIRFLPETNTTPKVIETVFGVVSSSLSKDLISLKKEAEFDQIVDKILSKYSDVEVEIDNTFIEFSNDEKFKIEEKALLLQNGASILEECQFALSKVSLNSVQNLVTSLSGTTTAGERKTVLNKQLDLISEESVSNIDEENKPLGKLSFFLKLIKGLITVILKSVVGPSVVLIMSIYLELAYGVLNFNDLKEFIQNNLKFYIDLFTKIVIQTIQKVLLNLLINILKEIIICNYINNKKQMLKQYQSSLVTLNPGGLIAQKLALIAELQQLGLG